MCIMEGNCQIEFKAGASVKSTGSSNEKSSHFTILALLCPVINVVSLATNLFRAKLAFAKQVEEPLLEGIGSLSSLEKLSVS
jgi:hypothetical protein